MILNVPIQNRIDLAANMPTRLLLGELFAQSDTGHLYVGLGQSQAPLQLSGGTGAVSSVFGRTGAVVAASADYSSVSNLQIGDGKSSLDFTTSAGSFALTDGIGSFLNMDGTGDVDFETATGKGGSMTIVGDVSVSIGDNGSDFIEVGSGTILGVASSVIELEVGTTQIKLSPTSVKLISSGSSFLSLNPSTDSFNIVAGAAGVLVTDPIGSVWNSATGGAQGAGTINSKGMYVNGAAVLTGGSLTVNGDGVLLTLPGPTIALGGQGTLSLNTQSANLVFAGPSAAGPAAAPSFRSLVVADLPATVLTTSSTINISQLSASAITINGDGTILSSPGSTALGGTAAFAFNSQSANLFLAGPTTGSAATPTFRAIVSGDLSSGLITWDQLGNAGAALTLSNGSNATTFNQTSAVNWTWANTTAATSGASQSSPILNLSGSYWTGSVSGTDNWTIQDVVSNGTNGASTLTFVHSGSTGTAKVSVPLLGLAGAGAAANCCVQINAAGAGWGFYSGTGSRFSVAANGSSVCEFRPTGFNLGSAVVMGWSSASTPDNVASDTGLSRISAGVVGIGTGAQGSVAGNLQLSQITHYNGEAVTAPGTAYIRGAISQKGETGADAALLSVTPASAAGLYRIAVVLSVSAASVATLGWTATWTDSNGHSQAPTNLYLSTAGSSTVALTVSAAANATYYGEWYVDVNNAGTAIVIKTTFSGTSIAYKATAICERIQ